MINILLLSLCLFSQAKVVDRIYATVDNEMVTTSDVKNFRTQLESRLLYEDLLFPSNQVIAETLKSRDALIKKIIDEKILDSEAKSLGITINNTRVQKEIDRLGGESQLSQLLAQKGLTMGDYKNFLRRSLARKEVINFHVTSKIKISDEDVMDFYVSKIPGSKAGQGFEFLLEHIIFEKDNEDSRKAASAAFSEMASTSFSSLQKKYNPGLDPEFGSFKSGEMLPSIENAIVSLKAGQTSAVVQSPMGFHIFKVKEKKVVEDPNFKRVKKRIFQVLYGKNYSEQLEYWLYARRKRAVIKIRQ